MRTPTESRRRLALALSSLAVAALIPSCGKSPTSPNSPIGSHSLYGQVVDANGFPVGKARVVVSFPVAPPNVSPAPAARSRESRLLGAPTPVPVRSFTVTNNPCSLGTVQVRFGLPHDATVHLDVIDPGPPGNDAIAFIRTLANGTFAAGSYTAVWDGRDDAGKAVRPGVYELAFTDTEGDSTFVHLVKVLWNVSDPSEPYALTADAQGRFEIPIRWLPLGTDVAATDVDGTPIGHVTVGPLLRVTATGPPGGLASVGSADVRAPIGQESANVVVQLPLGR